MDDLGHDDLKRGGHGNGQEPSENAQQLDAGEEGGQRQDRGHADDLRHDPRHEDVGLHVEHDHVENDHPDQLPRLLRQRHQDGHRGAEGGTDHRDELADPRDDAQEEWIRHLEQVEARGHRHGDGEGEQQLGPQPPSEFRSDPVQHHAHAGSLLGREEGDHPALDVGALQQHIEREDEDGDDRGQAPEEAERDVRRLGTEP